MAWSYETPFDEGQAYAGYIAFYWNKADRWFVDDEEVDSPPQDPQK
jgi:uncharacterized protein (DUF427 family)